MRNTLRKLGEEKTILLSTHILQEVGAMASRIIVVDEGQIKFDGPVEVLEQLDPSHPGLEHAFYKLTGRAHLHA